MGSSKGLSQNSSPYELSKLSAHSLEGVCWESAGSLLGVRWEFAGSFLGVHFYSAGSLLGVAGSPLEVLRKSVESLFLLTIDDLCYNCMIPPDETC